MNDLGTIVLVVLAAVLIVAAGWWLLIETEGVYLGRRVVVWLYDLYAGRYDDIKHFRSEYDHMFLAQPIMDDVAPVKAPLVLDVATGTGRLPLAMLNHAHFQGRVIGADLSRRMLANAASKLDLRRAPLLWCPAERLPFADNLFDVVTCLEALEFMERPEAVLAECARVLRPGGLLLVTNRRTTRFMPGKAWKNEDLTDLFKRIGMSEVALEGWQVDYDLLWARKRGESEPTLSRPLAEILCCPCCGQTRLIEGTGAWRCEHCGCAVPVGEDGVIELAPLYDRPLVSRQNPE